VALRGGGFQGGVSLPDRDRHLNSAAARALLAKAEWLMTPWVPDGEAPATGHAALVWTFVSESLL
jgi:hypothetical protein